ncbi:MAG TPA: hypothetical protein P5572_14525, partial [Phycisphaerae bacterium]|nr:hypothetical protein [Phycisphaerae bacterium]
MLSRTPLGRASAVRTGRFWAPVRPVAYGCAAALALVAAVGCESTNPPGDAKYVWSTAADAPGAALLSVHGTSADNVYAVGADDGHGPLVLHWNGSAWERLASGVTGDFWWVHAVGDTVYMTGSDANIVRYANGTFERMTTPGLGKNIVFGLWAASPSDVYAVGSKSGRNGFIWHYDGTAWTEVNLPTDIPQDDNHDIPQFVKVWGTSATDVWVVGEQGVILRGNAADGFELVPDPSEDFLFTVHGVGERVVAVGANGVVLDVGSQVTQTKIEDSALLQGVWVSNTGEIWATGAQGGIYRNRSDGFSRENTGITREIQSLHAVWVDPDDGVWAVGGNVLDTSLNEGVLLYGHPTHPAPPIIDVEDPAENVDNSCPAAAIDPEPEKSIARRWNEQILNAIRRDTPRPTVHARNLFHLSAAMWDAWAAYDATAAGYLVQEKYPADDVAAARDEAISYAAYRLLTHRYSGAVGGAVSSSCFDGFMAVLGYDPDVTTTTGDSPAAIGNRIGEAYIAAFANDGANEANNYADPVPYTTDVPRLVVDEPGSNTTDATQWQQLVLAEAVTQNGIPQGAGVQGYIGSHWRDVQPFALQRSAPGVPYFVVDAPTTLNDDLVDAAVEVLRRTSELDIANGVTIDISPGAIGNNPLGTNDGTGYAVNPVTGEPYEPDVVLRGDFGRVLAEFWADGPASETPPGHWNTLANDVSDTPGFERKLFGAGEELDPLSWDVHVYLALNGAVHDAAIAAWELKRTHLTARPITLLRTMGRNGQRSDPDGPSYDPEGLPLIPGLIEVITAETAAPGQRHAHLARYVGEIAVYSWRGEPGARKAEIGGIGWIRALDWVAYQRRTFVTPAFPGFVSGHSTFSRSAAEVLA